MDSHASMRRSKIAATVCECCEFILIEPLLKFPVCQSCHLLFQNEKNLTRHLATTHKRSRESAKHCAEQIFHSSQKGVDLVTLNLRKVYQAAPDISSGAGFSRPLPALEELAAVEGYMCPLCPHGTTGVRYLKEHFESSHVTLSKKQVAFKLVAAKSKGTVKLQTLLQGNKRSYFRVFFKEDPVAEADVKVGRSNILVCPSTESTSQFVQENERNNNDLSYFRALCDIPFIPVPTHECTGVQESLRNEFISRAKVLEIFESEGIDMDLAVKISATADTYSDEEKKLLKLAEEYLLEAPKYVSDAAPALLDKLYPREEKHFNSLDKRSVKRYACSFGRFLVAACRYSKLGKLNEKDEQVVQRLNSSLEIPEKHDIPLGIVHKAAKQLCLVRRRLSEGVGGMFVRIFFACSCVKVAKLGNTERHRLVEAHEISHMLAALQHSIMATALLELHSFSERYTSDEDRKEADECAILYGDEASSRETRILSMVARNENTAMSFVRLMLSCCMSILKKRTVDMSFEPCEQHQFCGFINGVELSLRDLGILVRKWQDEAERIMIDELLCGGRYPPRFEDSISQIGDDLLDKRPGFFFLRHSASEHLFRDWPAWVLSQIKRKATGTRKIFTELDNVDLICEKDRNDTIEFGQHRVHKEAIQKWLMSCRRVQDLLLVCIHVSSGSPARATEIETFRLMNSSFAQRNIYISQNDIVTLCRYSKMRSQAGTDTHVLRIPDKRTGYLLKAYVLLFRILEAKFVGLLHGEARMESHMEWMFVCRGERLSSEKIRQIISDMFKAEGKDLGIKKLRQYCAEMVRSLARFNASRLENYVKEYEDAGHAQAGHSTFVADRNYGRTPDDFVGLGRREVDKYRSFSREWHRFLFQLEREGDFIKSKIPSCANDNLKAPTEARLREVSFSEDTINNLLVTVSEKLVKSIHEGGARKCPAEVCGPPAKKPRYEAPLVCQTELIPPSTRDRLKDARRMLKPLRNMLQNSSAKFRCGLQADITASVLDGSEDMLVCVGTGFGKTLCVLLPIFIEKSNFVSIILTPFVALGNEMKHRCEEYGISAATWSERERTSAQVYIFAVEVVGREDYTTFIRSLESGARLRRIIIDEAHITITSDDFRPCLYKLQHMLHSVSNPVQRVLLSATIPFSERGRALTAHGMSKAVIFTSHTTRNNKKISVLIADGASREGYLETMIKTTMHSIRTELEFVGNGRVMIFSMRKADVKVIAQAVRSVIGSNRNGMVFEYHAGMGSEERSSVHEKWCQCTGQKVVFMVCTSAFGVGLDSPNVRLVYHIGGCDSLFQYTQEIGRAGRDGKLCKCVVIWNSLYASVQNNIRKLAHRNARSVLEIESAERRWIWWTQFCTWASDKGTCRSFSIFKMMDGADTDLCLQNEFEALCDICEEVSGTTKHLSCAKSPEKLERSTPEKKSLKRPMLERLNQESKRPTAWHSTNPTRCLPTSDSRSKAIEL